MSDSRRLAQELYEIRALALSHATSPQLGVSSVDGEGLVLRDGDGNDLGRIGGGENGMEVEYLYGPKPPQPSAPDVSADTNLISVRWDGLWADQSETDPDIVGSPVLDRVEVHVSSDENFVPDQIESLAGTMPVLDSGGQILVGPLAEAGDWYVVLLARGKDGQYGAPSDRVHVVTSVGLVENELFDLALRAGEAMESADGKNSVYYGDTEPEPQPRLDEDGEPVLDDDGNPLFNEFTEGDIWFGPGNMPHVWSEADGWVSAADERVDAIQSAVEDLESALDDVIVGAGMKSFYRGTMPTVEESSEGDLWFDVSDEYHPYRFTDGVWVSVLAGLADGSVTTDKIAEGAITAESGIIGSLDAGKITVGEMDGARIRAGSIQADLALIEGSVGSTLIADGAVTTDKILAGAVTTEKITAGGIDAGVITTGELRGELIRAQSIAASALAATAIDGKTITGATVRTAAAGARVEMNSSGLYVKNQFGTNTVSMQNGELSVSGGTITGGTVRTSASGARVQLDVTGLKAFNPSGDETFSISSNTGTVNMEGNLRQTNEYGRFDIGPTVFASGADGRGTPGIAFTRHSKPSGAAHQAGLALRQSGDGTGSFLQVQSEGGDAGWSFLNLATPGASAHTGLHRVFTGDDRSSFNINGDGNTYISTYNQAEKGNVWLQTYVRGRDHSQTRFSMQNSGRIFASTYVGSNPKARTSMLDMASEGTWLIAGSGTSATSARNLNLHAYGDAYMRAYGRGNNPAVDAYVGAQQDGGAVIASAGGSEWIGVGYTGTSPGGDGIYVRTRGDLTMYMGRWVAPNINTGSGTDLIITSSNYIGKKSSSRRYKIAEEPIEYTLPGIEDALLGMEVKTWFDRRSAERLAEAETEKTNGVVPLDDLKDVDLLRRIPGVVAEDLDEAGLGMFVVYNEDGSPESVMYDRLGVALVPAVKALRDRVNELEEKIGEWENG